MPRMLNLDLVTCDYIDITKGGVTYHLRDDVPTETLLCVFGMTREAYVRDIDQTDPAAVLAAVRRYQGDVAHLVGDIFRHTDPAITDAQVAATFTLAEQEQIIQLFFQVAGTASSPTVSAPSASARQTRRSRS